MKRNIWTFKLFGRPVHNPILKVIVFLLSLIAFIVIIIANILMFMLMPLFVIIHVVLIKLGRQGFVEYPSYNSKSFNVSLRGFRKYRG